MPKMTQLEYDLRKPFDPSDIKTRQAFGGNRKVLFYADARTYQQRLDEVFGVGGWQTRYPWAGCCELSVRIGDEWITKSDCADETNIEAAKGQASDAFKRACASGLGLGRFLYHVKPDGSMPKWWNPEEFEKLVEIVDETDNAK